MPGGKQPEPLGVYDSGEGVCRPVASWEHNCGAGGLRASDQNGPVLANYTPSPMGFDDLGERVAQGVANLGLARGFLFVVFEQLPEVGLSAGKIIRKVMVIPKDFSMTPRLPGGTLSLADHVIGATPDLSQYLSASDRVYGAPSIKGEPLLVDVAKAEAIGGKINTVADIVAELERKAVANPSMRSQLEKLMWAVEKVEGEIAIEGSVPPGGSQPVGSAHLGHIRSAEALWEAYTKGLLSRGQLELELAKLQKAYAAAKIFGRVGRVLTVVGVVLTVVDVGRATAQSVERKSWKPIGAEAIRQVGGWGGMVAGAKIGAVTGALFGIETGPGAIATGAVGALIFGAAGYFGMDLLADEISPN